MIHMILLNTFSFGGDWVVNHICYTVGVGRSLLLFGMGTVNNCDYTPMENLITVR